MWMTAGRQCRHCSVTVHKRCEEKLTLEDSCPPQSTLVEEDPPTTTFPLVNRASPIIETTTTTRSPRIRTNKASRGLPTLTLSELRKTADSTVRKPPGAVSPRPEAHSPTSSKLASAASSAYSKFFEPKSRRVSSSALEGKKNPQKSDSSEDRSHPFPRQPSLRLGLSENISTSDLQDILNVSKRPWSVFYSHLPYLDLSVGWTEWE